MPRHQCAAPVYLEENTKVHLVNAVTGKVKYWEPSYR